MVAGGRSLIGPSFCLLGRSWGGLVVLITAGQYWWTSWVPDISPSHSLPPMYFLIIQMKRLRLRAVVSLAPNLSVSGRRGAILWPILKS